MRFYTYKLKHNSTHQLTVFAGTPARINLYFVKKLSCEIYIPQEICLSCVKDVKKDHNLFGLLQYLSIFCQYLLQFTMQ